MIRGFFVHVMKTGGTSLKQMLLDGVLRRDEIFPNAATRQDQIIAHIVNLFAVRHRIPEVDWEPVRLIAGHYPFLSHRLLPFPTKTFALFREPVERAVSHLKALQRDQRTRSYEDLYSDRDLFDRYLYNLQARAFVFDDPNAPVMLERTFDWDEDFLARAKRNVECVDVIGLTSEFSAFTARLEQAFGWRLPAVKHLNTASEEQLPVPQSLRDRIREDLRYDVSFYEHVLGVYKSRA